MVVRDERKKDLLFFGVVIPDMVSGGEACGMRGSAACWLEMKRQKEKTHLGAGAEDNRNGVGLCEVCKAGAAG